MLLSYHAGATECMCFSIPFYVKGSLFISMGCPKYRKCTENVQKKSLTILQNRTTWERWCRWASRAACFCGGAWPGRLWRRTCLFDRCFSGITLFARTQSKTDNWPWTFFFFSFFSWPIQQMLCRLWDQLILVAREFFPGPRMHLKDDTFLYMLMNTCYLSFKGMLLSNL